MNTMYIIEPVVTRTNSCYDDYVKFSKLPRFELDAVQKSYYSELHALQDELDKLLDELRSQLAYIPVSQTRLSA